MSFSNASELQEAALVVPDEQILVETDAPFLTPHPYRGRRNQSYCLPYTARFLAALRGTSDEEMAAVLGAMPAASTSSDIARVAEKSPLRYHFG